MRPARPIYLYLGLIFLFCLSVASTSWAQQGQPTYPSEQPYPSQQTNPDQPPPQAQQAPPDQPYPDQAGGPPEAAPAQAPPESAEQLQQLVAPIALYPDSLVAQILTASTFPTQIVEAERWLQQNRNLQGQQLADAANQQPWDPSVKALTAFPSVMANMDQDLSWTQSLGDAYYNQPQDVMNAVQVMRKKAQVAGNLKSSPQQTVAENGSEIEIQPASPDLVYVPVYDPWLVYGPPIPVWPGFVFGGIWVNRPYFGFGLGINLGFWRGYGWGWPAWGFDWRGHQLFYHRAPYFPRGPAFFDHRDYRGFRGGPGFRGPRAVEPPVGRGFGPERGQVGVHSGAFSGYAHGGVTRGYAERGMGSMHGGEAHGGGGRR